MTVKPGSANGIVFAAEGVTGTACAAALKKVRSLASSAPSGRAFAAIATLADCSQTAENHLKAGNDALSRGDGREAQNEWARAVKVMDQMVHEARGGHMARPASGPDYLRKR
ncbi:hypothetical protein [Taklimakanibacter lacteus]|uniref:hypothetical protein n=1 Tax=Taklimakanibacter lacteus TaxID=2268456 RepID=UPI000E6676A5